MKILGGCKMGKLYGYKRWYEIQHEDEKNGKKRSFKRKIRVKRVYDEESKSYVVRRDEVEDTELIKNKNFIINLKEYKTQNSNIQKFYDKFHVGNILFKLKASVKKGKKTFYKDLEKVETVLTNVEILEQTIKLANNSKINRKKLEKELPQLNINEKSEEITIDNIKIYLKQGEKFDKKENINAIKWRKLTSGELTIKVEIYRECQSINSNLYSLLDYVLSYEKYDDRYYLEELENKLLIFGTSNRNKNGKNYYYLDYVLKSLSKIKELIKKDDRNLNYLMFLFNVQKTSENKEHFINKIFNYFKYEVRIEKEDIVEFLLGELEYYDLIKRIEKKPSENQNQTNLEKTYILLDKHEKLKETIDTKNEIVQKLIIELKNNNLRNRIEIILHRYKILELVDKLNKNIKNGKINTELYGIYKEHYGQCIEYINFNELALEEKELYKIIYRYLKGRIEKLLQNRKKIKIGELRTEDIFIFQKLLEKIEIRVKQYLLEHIIYIGKVRHHNIKEVNTKKFVEEHANEELALELITLFSATNTELNRFFSIKNEYESDFFGDTIKEESLIKVKIGNIATKVKLLQELKFIGINDFNISNCFIKFLAEGYRLRNKILHGNMDNIFKNNSRVLEERYIDVKNAINMFRVSDQEICKNLNLDIVFEGKKELIKKINEIDFVTNNEKHYFPSFSKLVPEIKKIIQQHDINSLFKDENIEKIVLNGAIYVNKILYLKECSNENNGFMKELEEKLDGITIEELYKKAQILASKGNKNAIKKFQKRIIDTYLEYIVKNYKEIIDFSNLNLNIEKIEEKIKNRENSENKIIINSLNEEVSPENDFEYVISVFALLNDNIFINKIRNRFFATDVWLEEDKYNNIIKILDEIISVNLLRDELMNGKDDVGLINIDNIMKTLPEISELKAEIKKLKKIRNEEIENKKIDLMNSISNKKIAEIINSSNLDEKIKKDLSNLFLTGKATSDKREAPSNIVFKYCYSVKATNLKELEKDDREKILEMIKVNKKEISQLINNYLEKEYEEEEKKIELKLGIEELEKKLYKKSVSTPYYTLEKYNTIFSKLVKNEKFKDIYYQERKEHDENEKLFIYNKNVFNLITKPNFEKLYKVFLEDQLNNLESNDTKIISNFEIRREKISNIDNFLREINEKVKGYSEKYKEKIVWNIKNQDEYFKEVINKKIDFKNYEEFEKIYTEVSKYKKIRYILNFNVLNKINNYLIEVNWKLAIQMARLERDLHYIINGLNELQIIELDEERNNDRSRAYPEYKDGKINFQKCYYNFKNDSYQKLEDVCKKFEIDLSERSELQKKKKENIRNYISHFYILRDPFVDISIAEAINRVANLLTYRTRYNNSTYNSVFEVFKKDVTLNYEFLKKKIYLNEDKYEKIVQRKKISCLELESYLNYKSVIKTFLFHTVEED
jgi:hypothetical protein